MKTKYAALLMVLSVVFAMVACSDSGTKTAATAQPGVEEAVRTAVDAYIYCSPRRYLVYECVAGRFEGAVDPQRSRHGGPLLPAADAGRMDGGVPGSRQ